MSESFIYPQNRLEEQTDWHSKKASWNNLYHYFKIYLYS